MTVFSAHTPTLCLKVGDLEAVVCAAYLHLYRQNFESVLIFNDRTSDIIGIDLSGDLDFVARKPAAYPIHPYITKKSPASETNERDMRREVELMPRHWDWLSQQKSGAPATLRRLIDTARRDPAVTAESGREHARDLTYKFSNAVAGDLINYEEMLRSLYRSDEVAFNLHIAQWPSDIASRAKMLAKPVW